MSKDTLIEPTLGMRIRQARELAGIRQGEMAERLGITGGAMSQIESDRNPVTIDRLLQIAQITGRAVTWFLPAQDRGDLAACLRSRYPDITPEAIRSVETLAAWLASPASKIPPPDAPHSNGY